VAAHDPGPAREGFDRPDRHRLVIALVDGRRVMARRLGREPGSSTMEATGAEKNRFWPRKRAQEPKEPRELLRPIPWKRRKRPRNPKARRNILADHLRSLPNGIPESKELLAGMPAAMGPQPSCPPSFPTRHRRTVDPCRPSVYAPLMSYEPAPEDR
jgi:hypothetical protein